MTSALCVFDRSPPLNGGRGSDNVCQSNFDLQYDFCSRQTENGKSVFRSLRGQDGAPQVQSDRWAWLDSLSFHQRGWRGSHRWKASLWSWRWPTGWGRRPPSSLDHQLPDTLHYWYCQVSAGGLGDLLKVTRAHSMAVSVKQSCFITLGAKSGLCSQWQRDSNRLWTGKPNSERCRSESQNFPGIFSSTLTFLLFFPVGYFLCDADNIRHLTEYKGCEYRSAASNVSDHSPALVIDHWALLYMNVNKSSFRTSWQDLKSVEALAKVSFF